MEIEEKHKAIAIPVSLLSDPPKFLTVRDRRFKEWIFVTGGCRKKEVSNPIYCALRELDEETRGVVNLRNVSYNYFNFRVRNRTPNELLRDRERGVEVVSVYHVYVIFFNLDESSQKHMIERFNFEKLKTDNRKRSNMSIKRTHDENDFMSFDTLQEFIQKPRWDLITNNVLHNPEFKKALDSSNCRVFNMTKI